MDRAADVTIASTTRMRDYLTNDWPHPPGSHRYTASDFGITRAAVDEAFAPYIDSFTVPLEGA